MKRVAIIFGFAVVLILLIGLAIPLFVDANQFRPELQTRLGQTLGREVAIGDLGLSIFSGSVNAKDLSIGEDRAFGRNPFVKAGALKVSVELIPLILSRRVNVTGITIQKPDINLIQNAAGTWNFASLGGNANPKAATPKAALAPATPSQSGTDFSIASVKIADGRVTVRKLETKAKPIIMDAVALEMKNVSETSSFPFSMTASLPNDGRLRLNGNAGPINAGNVVTTPFDAKLAGSHLDLVPSGLMDASSGISGLVSIDGSAKSQGAKVAIHGKLRAEQLKLVTGGSPAKRPLEMDWEAAQDLDTLTGTIQRANIHMGSAAAAITGTYRLQTEPATIRMKLSGSKMPVSELAAILPALDVVMPSGASIEGGTAELNLACEGPLDKLVTIGTVALENTKLANYDLATQLKVIEALAGIKAEPHTTIQTFSTAVKNSPSGTVLDNIRLVVPSIGDMTGDGTISPSHELNFRMRLNVTSGVAATSNLTKNGIPFMIAGTSANPSFRPDVTGVVTEQLKQLPGAAGAAGDLIDGLFGGKKKRP